LEDSNGSAHVDERTALLQQQRSGAAEVEDTVIPVSAVNDSSVVDLVKDYNFWALAFIMSVLLGSMSCSIHITGWF